jgi:hypothetical protein
MQAHSAESFLLSTLLLTWFQSSLVNVSIDKKEAARILFPNVFSRIILRMTHDKPRHKMQWFLAYIFQSFILANVGMTSTAIKAIIVALTNFPNI